MSWETMQFHKVFSRFLYILILMILIGRILMHMDVSLQIRRSWSCSLENLPIRTIYIWLRSWGSLLLNAFIWQRANQRRWYSMICYCILTHSVDEGLKGWRWIVNSQRSNGFKLRVLIKSLCLAEYQLKPNACLCLVYLAHQSSKFKITL